MLSDAQIKKLFEFCEKKQVRYYDVQLELVDHLANSIEEKMEANPLLSFEEALQIVYKDFGIFGFSHIIREKETSVYQEQRKIFYALVKEQLGWPAIFLFIASAILFLSFFAFTGAFVEVVIFLMIAAIIILSYTNFSIKKLRKRSKKHLSITSFFYQSFWIYIPLYLVHFPIIFAPEKYIEVNTLQTVLISIVCSLYIVCLIAHYQTYLKVKNGVKNKYPELFPAN